MAIALRATGTRLKVDTSATAGPYNVSLPAGHVSTDGLFLFVLTDDNTNTTADPSGWTRLFYITNGSSIATPYTPRQRLKVYYRIDNGSLGASVGLTFDTTSSWPTGKPSVLAFCVAYSGVDTTAPIDVWDWTTTTVTTAAQAHPALTTTRASDWLITYRALASDTPAATFTDSVGTDVERVDDSDTIPELACALYDSNAALVAGLQTTRTTTASRAATYGSLMVSIAIQPPSAVGSTQAHPSSAEAIASAYDTTVNAVSGPWAFCGTGGLPSYSFAVDWAGDGLIAAGQRLTNNPYVDADTTDWTPINASVARVLGIISDKVPVLQITSTAGSSPRARSSETPVIAGQSYRVTGWLMAPSGLPSTAELDINWYNSSHVFQSLTGTVRAVPAGVWTWVDATVSAPAGISFATLTAVMTGTPGSGNVLYGYGLMIIDPSAAGSVILPSPGDDITEKITSDVSISYGRDQNRQLNPAATGSASFSVINADRTYSPDFATSVLYGDLEPARQTGATVTFNGNDYPLLFAKIDDYNIKADMSDRTVDFTFLDGLADLQNVKLSTAVYESMRTGDLINTILDLVGWTGPRDIGLGATVVPYWWVEGTDALAAVIDLIKSEGPPSIAYQAPDGTFVFRDRHHRLQRSESIGVQATFAQSTLMDCHAPVVSGFDFTAPFSYAHGWRDIINSVEFEVTERVVDASFTPIWTNDGDITIGIGESEVIDFSGSDPFVDAILPVQGTDYTTSGAGTLNVVLSRNSGQSGTLTLLAVGGTVTVSSLQVRARAISTRRNIKVTRKDTGSIGLHGEKSYPETAPWANANDADAIAGMILLHYAKRRPTIQMRITSQDPSHFVQALTRTVSDRIHVVYGEMGIDEDFFVESVQHTIQRFNQSGHPPVHAVILGCERDLSTVANPFTFDKRGAGFDEGVFDPIQADQADTVFIFDHPTQGQFDVGLLGT